MGLKKKVHRRSLDLTEIQIDKVVITPTPIPKLGATLWHNDESFWTFTGDAPQRTLIYSRYEGDFIPLTNPLKQLFLQVNIMNGIVRSGVLYIDDYDLWVIAYIHMEADQEADIDGRGRLDLFDGDFNLLDRHFFGTTATYRSHLPLSTPIFIWDMTMSMFRLKKSKLYPNKIKCFFLQMK